MGSYGNFDGVEVACNGFHSHTTPQLGRKQSPPSWFDVRVFYFRISNGAVDDSTPESLTLIHIPLDPDTLLEVNCTRCGINSDGISSSLRRDRLDKKFEEVTYVSTDNIRFTGSVRFQVFNGEDIVLSGVLELCSSDDNNGELQNHEEKWRLWFESESVIHNKFLKAQHNGRPEGVLPTIEVYVAGCFSGAPIILTKTLQLHSQTKKRGKSALDLIPEHETIGTENDANGLNTVASRLDLQAGEYANYKMEGGEDLTPYWRNQEYTEDENGELTWFNAGVRVGVGISLGVCLGVGLGLGLLARTYQTTSRTFRRRFL